MQHLHGEASVPHTWDTCKQQEKNNNKNIGHRLEHKRSDYFQGTKQIILNKMVFDMKWDITQCDLDSWMIAKKQKI